MSALLAGRSGVGSMSPRPTCDAPSQITFCEGHSPDRAGLLNRIPVLFPRQSHGQNRVGLRPIDIDVPRLPGRRISFGDAILGNPRIERIHPFRAHPWTVPCVRRDVVDDRTLIGTCGKRRLRIALVETVDPLMQHRRYVGPVRCCDRLCAQGCDEKENRYFVHDLSPYGRVDRRDKYCFEFLRARF
jgi:hypothetical protein